MHIKICKNIFVKIIYFTISIVFFLQWISCSNTIKKAEVHSTEVVNYLNTFTVKRQHNIGLIADLVYYLDTNTKQEYAYLLNVSNEDSLIISKYLLSNDLQFNFLENITLNIKYSVHNMNYCFYTVGLDSFILFRNGEDRCIKNHYIKEKLLLSDTLETSVFQNKYMLNYYPFYDNIQHFNFEFNYIPVFEPLPKDKISENTPCFITNNSKKSEIIWNVLPSKNKKYLLNFSKHFKIYLKDKVIHLRPDANKIEIYSELTKKKEEVIIKKEYGLRDISYNKNIKVLLKENDYWLNFSYNAIKREYILIKHIGYPYSNSRLNKRKKIEEIFYEIIILDKNFEFQKAYGIKGGLTNNFVAPVFPTYNGLVTVLLKKELVNEKQLGLTLQKIKF